MKFQFNDGKFTSEFPAGTLEIAKDDVSGFRPYQLLVAGIVSCSGFVFQQIYEKQRMDVVDFYIKTDVTRNEAEANKIEELHLTYVIKGNDLNEQKLRRNLEITHKYCGMVQSVKDSIHIYEKLEIIS